MAAVWRKPRALLFIATSAGLVSVVGLLLLQAQRFIVEAENVQRAYQVLDALDKVESATLRAESATRGFALTGSARLLAGDGDPLAVVVPELDRLARLSATTPAQAERVAALGLAVSERVSGLRQQVLMVERDDQAGVIAAVLAASTRERAKRIRALAQAIRIDEGARLAARQEAATRQAEGLRVLGVLAALMLAVNIGLIVAEARRRRSVESKLRASTAELADALRAASERSKLDEGMAAFSEHLHACRTLPEVAGLLASSLPALLPTSHGGLFVLNASARLLERHARWGSEDTPLPDTLSPDDCWGMRRGAAYPTHEGSPPCAHHSAAGLLEPASRLCVPLNMKDDTAGLIMLGGGSTDTAETRRRLVQIAEQLSLALANLRLQESLRQQSLRDPLTGLNNRRFLDESLAREWARALRHGQPIALMMLDVDHFKTYNDLHGHDAGDAALAAVAGLIARAIRNEDIAARFGGEEFAIVLPCTGVEAAVSRAEAIRKSIESLAVVRQGRSLPGITASIGVAVHPGAGTDPASCLRAADEALYRAKKRGRNRVELANGD